MTIINPNNMPYTPADKPTVTTVSKTTTSITYSITNPNSIQAKILYEIGDDTPDANNITLAGGASQNVTVSGLTANTNYILYTQAFTATGYSLVGSYSETTEADALYAFTTFTFTNAAVDGPTGPTIAQIRAAYSSQSWAQNDAFLSQGPFQGYQRWTVPQTGTYRIRAEGASGAYTENRPGNGGGGSGAVMEADFNLSKNDFLILVVGQTGRSSSGNSIGGGGGSFVVKGVSSGGNLLPGNVRVTPLIIAGGGGGRTGTVRVVNGGDSFGSTNTQNRPGWAGFSSTSIGLNTPGNGGTIIGDTTYNAASGGYLTSGPRGDGGTSNNGFLQGCVGVTLNDFYGGFGGGGGATSSDIDRTGCAGGGYTGSSGGRICCGLQQSAFGGGGSFLAAEAINPKTSDGQWSRTGTEPHTAYNGSVSNLGFFRNGNGQITITKL